jgi:hypothetical protein
MQLFLHNLQSLYNQHNYNFDHIWNYDEIGIQVGRQSGTKVLARRGFNAFTSSSQNCKNNYL